MVTTQTGWKKAKVAQSCPTPCDSVDCTIHGVLQARILGWFAFPFSRGSSQPRDWTQLSCIAGGFLRAEPQGKPKNTGMGSLSLLQQIFPTQELTQGLLNCKQILYQLNYWGILLHLICQQIWNSAVAIGLEKLSSSPKERQCQKMVQLPDNGTHFTC